MKIMITGAGGFVGRQLVNDVLGLSGISRLTLIDQHLSRLPEDDRVRAFTGDLTDKALRDEAIDDGVDVLYHLAALPGGAAEGNYVLSRKVNLEASLDLVEEIAARSTLPRIVYTSTIAVFGAPMPDHIDDHTPLAPALTYGAHKLMMEVALADLSRKGMCEAVMVRLPGILARPKGPSGMRSAFMSDIFHALAAGQNFTCPTTPEGHVWAMSVRTCARNLLHAAQLDTGLMPDSRVVTLPALRFSMGELAQTLCRILGADPDLVSYAPDPLLQAQFAALPPLETPAADRAGFRHDGTLENLVTQALQGIGVKLPV
ncbi:MAG: NAD-dependent epimerase/dehydratase family protein [Asticcacaulis sp.]